MKTLVGLGVTLLCLAGSPALAQAPVPASDCPTQLQHFQMYAFQLSESRRLGEFTLTQEIARLKADVDRLKADLEKKK